MRSSGTSQPSSRSSRGTSPAAGRARAKAAGTERPRTSTCSRCGAKRSVRLQKRIGRSIAYRTLPALPLPEDVAIPTCSRCKAEFLDKATRKALAPLLARLYAAELRRRIQGAIEALSQVTSQRQIEKNLGLSQGYLSRLKAGAGTPSPALVLQLQQLALDPIPRLREVERIWGEPISS
jgi:hypothetical protein